MYETYSNIYLSNLYYSVGQAQYARGITSVGDRHVCIGEWFSLLRQAPCQLLLVLPFISAYLIDLYFNTILRGPFGSLFHMVRRWRGRIEAVETNRKWTFRWNEGKTELGWILVRAESPMKLFWALKRL